MSVGNGVLGRAARWGAAGASLGAVVAVLNFATGFRETDYGRSFLVALLTIWCGLGLAAGFSAAAIATLARRGGGGRREPAAAARRSWGAALVRAWVVASGLGLAALAAYLGSAPRFSGFISDAPRSPAAEAAGPPNVVIVSLDTTRSDHLGAYRYARGTSPSFDALASRGALFTRAVATSSWTVPSHASFFTGMAPLHLGPPFGPREHRSWVKLPGRATTLAEIFREAGYHTAGFIGGPTLQKWFGFDQGFDVYADRGPVSLSARSHRIFGAETVQGLLGIPRHRYLRFLDPPFVRMVNFFHDERYEPASDLRAELMGGDIRWSLKADEVNHRVYRWLDRRPPRPYLLFVHYFDPHDPYEPPPETMPPGFDLRGAFITQNGLLESVLKNGRRITARERENLIAGYDAEIAWMDRQLGELLARLEAEGDLKNALIAVVSDHGEAFGEHGLLFHGHHLYGELTRAVFLLAGRGAPEGLRVDEPVSGIDLAPTILALAGLDVAWGAEGRSLAPLLSGGSVEPAPLFSEVFGGRLSLPDWEAFAAERISVEWEGMKLIYEIGGSSRLYDLRSDPGETVDVAFSRPEVAASLQALVDNYLAFGGSPSGEDAEAPPVEVLESLRALGYVH